MKQEDSEQATARRPSLTWKRKLIYAVFTVAAVAAGIEGSARVVWWRLQLRSLDFSARGREILKNDAINFMKVADATYGYRLKSNFKMPGLSINSAGFHQADEVPVRKRAGYLRVVCLGESTTFGTNDALCYPFFLGQLLRRDARSYPHYEVINAGVPGWDSDQVAMRVHDQVARYKPDIAILYVGWNDFQGFDPRLAPPSKSAFEAWFGGTIWKQYAVGNLRSVALLSALYARLHTSPAAATGREVQGATARSPELQYRFLIGNMSHMVRDLQAENSKIRVFVCTLVGLWPQGTEAHWREISKGVPWWVTQNKLSPPEVARYVGELNDVLRNFARSQHLFLIDMAAAFENLDRQRLQFDWAHMYSDGYELMAWNMLAALYSSGAVSGDMEPRYAELMARYSLPPPVKQRKTFGP